MRCSLGYCHRAWAFGRFASVAALAAATVVVFINRGTAGDDGPTVDRVLATHAQSNCIDCCAAGDGTKLEDFCVSPDGHVLAVVRSVGAVDVDAAQIVIEEPEDNDELDVAAVVEDATNAPAESAKTVVREVRVFDADGNLAHHWALDFDGQAINVGPDGLVYVAGDGQLAKFDMDGNLLAKCDSPQMSVVQDVEQLRQAAAEQLEIEKQTYQPMVDRLKKQLAKIEEKAASTEQPKEDAESGQRDEDRRVTSELDNEAATKGNDEGGDEDAADADDADDDDLNGEEQDDDEDEDDDEVFMDFPQNGPAQVQVLKQQLNLYERYVKRTVEEVVQEISANCRKVNAIAVGDRDVYVACRATKGYGYAVWTTDSNFENPRQIIQGLVGCCGQMDIQATGDELWIAENSKHRVVQFDREGKEISAFGKRDRDGEADCFSGCCNPMNLCFNNAGDLFVSESNGVVKHFDKKGNYLGLIGVASVQTGCKNSAVGVTPDGERVFYIDINKSKVIVLARAGDQQASDE